MTTGANETVPQGELPQPEARPGYRPPIAFDPPPFLAGLDSETRARALERIRAAWSHHSTAIEGNILTLEQTTAWLETGEYAGLPAEQYHEVGGQAEALDLLWTLLDRELETRDLLDMHEVLLPPVMRRPADPVGRWKTAPNGIVSRGPGRPAGIPHADRTGIRAVSDDGSREGDKRSILDRRSSGQRTCRIRAAAPRLYEHPPVLRRQRENGPDDRQHSATTVWIGTCDDFRGAPRSLHGVTRRVQ